MAGGSKVRHTLCTACGRTAAPATLVAGSDLLELCLWGFLLVPGMLYCWWRHVSRHRICPHCGSAALMRKSRARRRSVPSSDSSAGHAEPGGRLVYPARRIAWMASPSVRFRRLWRGGALTFAAAGLVLSVVSFNTVRVAETHGGDKAAFKLPPSEGEVARERESRTQNRREYECERLCAEFNRAKAGSQRQCLQNCVATLFDDVEARDSAEPADGCADLLDRTACDFVSGRGGPARDPR